MSTMTNTSLPKSSLKTELSKKQLLNIVYSKYVEMPRDEQRELRLTSACNIPLLGWFLKELGMKAESTINENALVMGVFPGVEYKLILNNIVIATGYFFRDNYQCKNWDTETLKGNSIQKYGEPLKLSEIVEMFENIQGDM